MKNKPFKDLEIDFFFLLSGMASHLLGTFFFNSKSGEWNLVRFASGLVFFVSCYLLQRYAHSLSKSKWAGLNQSTGYDLSKPGLKPVQYIPAIFLLTLIFTCLYFLLKQQVLIGINLIFLSVIALLIFVPTSTRVGHPFRLMDWFFKSLIVSPLLFILGISVQAMPLTGIHFLLAVPLFFLVASSFVALAFPRYAQSPEEQKRTLIPAIGLEQTISMHNILILLAYLGLVAYLYLSGSFRSNWTLLLISLISFIQMFLLHRIALGMKPNYGLLKTTAVLQTLSFIYLLILNALI